MKSDRPLRVIVLIVALFLVFQGLCQAGLFTNKSASMEPTIKVGQKIWVSGYAKGTDPSRGDIIAFNTDQGTMIKRVIGLPGEKVIVQDGLIHIAGPNEPQGKKLEEPYLGAGSKTEPNGTYEVPKGQYFVLGDNRGKSLDSRAFGCIAREKIIGRVTKTF